LRFPVTIAATTLKEQGFRPEDHVEILETNPGCHKVRIYTNEKQRDYVNLTINKMTGGEEYDTTTTELDYTS
jgi:hypothetical protein